MKEQAYEIINPFIKKNSAIKFVLFDFDGTISLIREGWQAVMKSYFYEELRKTPVGETEPEEALRACIDEFVEINTGKQTIYQCLELAEEITKRGGEPLDAFDYKDEYQRRLLKQIDDRIKGLENHTLNPVDHVVPGSFELLEKLTKKNLILFLASGTDQNYVEHEAKILGVDKYIKGGIYGAQRDYKRFSKKMVVNKIINENNLPGAELLAFGDGFVEIENVKEVGGTAVGVASDEKYRSGKVDTWKRNRLIRAKADIIIPDFTNCDALLEFLL